MISMNGSYFCPCGLKFKKEHYYKNHLKSCKFYITTDGTYEVTILGDKLKGWTLFPDNLLYRCPKQKHFQLQHLLQMPINSSFLDIGSHFGDTVCTFAIYAKNNNRNDINFFAFEPNKDKCDYISKISKLNNLNIQIFNNCIGNNNNTVDINRSSDKSLGNCIYEESSNGSIKTIKLDDIKNIIEPVGYMHIDVEGWEPKVLNGAKSILNNKNNKMIIFAECWDNNTSISKGFSSDPEQAILDEIKNIKYERFEDYIEFGEKNMVLKVN